MAVSAGGGSSFLIGQDGNAVPRKIFSFKYGRRIQGTVNNPSDKDIGYIVELAIPWREMGIKPTPGMVMGFNFISRMKGENTGFVSLSPDVKEESDIQVPAKWARIKLVNTPTILSTQDGAYICRKVIVQTPVIDGNLSKGEWSRDHGIIVMKPEPVASAAKPEEQVTLQKLVMSHYFYWYQSDSRKDAPVGHVREAGGVRPAGRKRSDCDRRHRRGAGDQLRAALGACDLEAVLAARPHGAPTIDRARRRPSARPLLTGTDRRDRSGSGEDDPNR
jgi:hypothetical protein